MLLLITGVPGAGKTLRAMWYLEQPEYVGRQVYSNIEGAAHLPLPHGEDWRDTPPGSIVVYDEAQKFFPGTGRAGNSQDERVQAMEEHRHTGHDLIFITQRYALVHHHLRGLVGRHEHLIPRTKSVAVVFTLGEVFDPQDRSKLPGIAESLFSHPKKLYESYVSSSLHTKAQTTYQVPLKLKLLAGALVLALAWLAWSLNSSLSFREEAAETAGRSTGGVRVAGASELVRELPSWNTPGMDGIGGCVSTRVHCRCYDRAGRPIDFDRDECLAQLHAPVVRNLRFGGEGGGARVGASPAPPGGGSSHSLPLSL